MKTVDILTIPTQGKILIEASAGTGKTYTITSLVIRLLLDHLLTGAPQKTIEQLLVVTFTKSATNELRERIQTRLYEARVFLNQKQETATKDTFFNELKEALKDKQREDAYLCILQAERMIHHAKIHTIHGFCTNLLKQFSLETKHLFDISLNEKEPEVIKNFAQQLWREKIYSSQSAQNFLRQALWKSVIGNTPDTIISTINQWNSRARSEFEPYINNLEHIIDSIEHLEIEFRQGWSTDTAKAIEERLLELKKGRSYTKGNIPKWVAKISTFVNESNASFSTLKEFHYLAYERIQTHLEVPLDLPPSTIRLLEIIDALIPMYESMHIAVHPCLRDHYQVFLDTLLEEKRELTFSSILKYAAKSVDADNTALIEDITHTYPVAIIDEFQDTDPEQFHIFDTLFGNTQTGNDTEPSSLYMIGDPKQAIYAFRGGDIYTYLHAKAGANEQFTLDTNWRSSSTVVDAINHVFSQVESPFLHDQIPYQAVHAANSEPVNLTINKQEQAALTWLTHEDIEDKPAAYRYEISNYIAKHIASTLEHGQITEDAEVSTIRENQIAILVQNKTEAASIKAALDAQALPYTYFSEKQHVFQSEQAYELLFLLQAIARPKSISHLKTLLACTMVNLSLDDINALDGSDFGDKQNENKSGKNNSAINDWQQLLQTCAQLLQSQSLFNALHHFYQEKHIIAQLQAQADGTQSAANLLQLTEILHENFANEKNISRVISYLQQQRQYTFENEDLRQRIGSTDSRINIYTLHKSKGLEFDIVYLPFVSTPQGFKANKNTLHFYHRQSDHGDTSAKVSELKVNLNNDDTAKQLAQEESLAEQIRLCYVGITRSKYACYIGLMPYEGLANTAIGNLLNIDTDNYSDTLEKLCEHPHISSQDITESIRTDLSTASASKTNDTFKTAVKTFNRKLTDTWRISSYTQLTHKKSTAHTAHFVNTETFDDADTAPPQQAEQVIEKPSNNPRFNFPKGVQAGLFWHDWLEHTAFDKPKKHRQEQAQEQLPKLCQNYGIDASWQEDLITWLNDILKAPLAQKDEDAFTLSNLSKNQRINEMEFLIPIASLNGKALNDTALNDILNTSPLSRKAPEHLQLTFADFEGFLKGFIDLTFEHNGKFYIADYKSNYLGNTDAHYEKESLEHNVLHHRYDVQLLLYVFALHCYLKNRIADYNYDSHIGGAYYLYLRGMNKKNSNGIFFHKPDFSIIQMLENQLNQQTAGGA